MERNSISRNEITELRELARSATLRYESRRVVVEGFRAIAGARQAKADFHSIILSADDSRFENFEVPIIKVDDKTIERIATTNSPQSCIAICSMPVIQIKDINAGKLRKSNVFVMDNVSDPGNLGTIIRSAVAFGVGALITIGGCDPFHPKVVRSSAGTIFALPTLTVDEFELGEVFERREILAASAEAENTLQETKFPNNAAIVFGNEAHGIITPFFENNTRPFTIPMAELCESLNVAMTATIVAHHLASKYTESVGT